MASILKNLYGKLLSMFKKLCCHLRLKQKSASGHYAWRNAYIIPCLFCILLCDCQTSKSVSSTSTKRRALLTHLEDPEVCAFLDMISYAEGTMSENGYRLIYSYEEFTSFNDHPRCIVCAQSNGTKLCSSAAGRYQISQKEWDRIAGIIGAKDFSPLNQDCAAVFLLLCSGALDALKTGNFSDAVNKVRKIWASMPDAPYNQPTKKEYELKTIYQKQLILHKNRLRHRNNGGDRP